MGCQPPIGRKIKGEVVTVRLIIMGDDLNLNVKRRSEVDETMPYYRSLCRARV